MYLIDTNVISELRKKNKANDGVKTFFNRVKKEGAQTYLSVVTVGELRRGVDLIRHRGDRTQAALLETWLNSIIDNYRDNLLDFTPVEAQIWGRLRVPHPENALDKQIAATAFAYDLCLVTRNIGDFKATGMRVLNPFLDES
jgi:toxin FitB